MLVILVLWLSPFLVHATKTPFCEPTTSCLIYRMLLPHGLTHEVGETGSCGVWKNERNVGGAQILKVLS